MPVSRVRLVARLMWIAPLLLLGAGLALMKTPLDLARTLHEGSSALARVVAFQSTNRTEVSYDALTLRVPVAGQDSLTHVVSVPHGIAPLVGEDPALRVRVLPGSARPVVIQSAVVQSSEGPVVMDIGRTQMWIAGVSSAISLFGALLLGWPILAWNRYLARHGDPGERAGEDVTAAPRLAAL